MPERGTAGKREQGTQEVPTLRFLGELDLHLLAEGKHIRSYDKLGAHLLSAEGIRGTHFAVWAPEALRVSVIGSFNGWDPKASPMSQHSSGVWSRFEPEVEQGALYKYHVISQHNGYSADKADPYAFASEIRPLTASKVWTLDGYHWEDQDWMTRRKAANGLDAPMSIYEVHLGSWKRVLEDGNRWLTYRELAEQLGDYVEQMGFTHVEFLPITEHPFDGSWGYQTVGYFAPTSRFGTPQDLMFLVDSLHQRGIGVILDWVPAHFPRDGHGLGFFDGSHLYEHSDPRQGQHPDWDTFVFNYGRWEVRNFLISNALFWLDKYHVDGLRVDAVASMLYLDYGRKDGEWIPNAWGGKENLDAIDFLKELNQTVYREYPDVITIAEESTSWPMVSKPVYLGGLGFGFKWNMGWMHDTLDYMALDPVFRSFHQDRITFSTVYAFSENFVLPFSHDEVVHLKASMIGKMPGGDWFKFANLRLLYGYMFGHPGKKLLFMGGESGQWHEWNHDSSLDWHLLDNDAHRGLQRWVQDLNKFYRAERALYSLDFDLKGFRWIDCNDTQNSVITFRRDGDDGHPPILFICNFTPIPRQHYRVGAPLPGNWKEVLNSDAAVYGGSGQGNLGGVTTSPVPCHGYEQSVSLTLPPLGVLVLKAEEAEP